MIHKLQYIKTALRHESDNPLVIRRGCCFLDSAHAFAVHKPYDITVSPKSWPDLTPIFQLPRRLREECERWSRMEYQPPSPPPFSVCGKGSLNSHIIDDSRSALLVAYMFRFRNSSKGEFERRDAGQDIVGGGPRIPDIESKFSWTQQAFAAHFLLILAEILNNSLCMDFTVNWLLCHFYLFSDNSIPRRVL